MKWDKCYDKYYSITVLKGKFHRFESPGLII